MKHDWPSFYYTKSCYPTYHLLRVDISKQVTWEWWQWNWHITILKINLYGGWHE
jgi:hypothetical protein